ncbi:MAG: arylsulfatase [Bryobacterales bacterium]|nr:arylsulfatase [Bryobacterales bacterium]
MTRRELLGTMLAAPAVAAASKPNVVVLLADDLGWADVGFHGSDIRTPNIDRLAREGTQLDRFYSFPVCSPTRSALMTGRTPMRLGLGYTVIRPWSSYALPLREHTMAESFRAAGYQTAMAGKWHLGHAERRYFPMGRGFDHQYGHLNGAIDYFTHVRDGGLDWNRDGKSVEEEGYSTDLIGAEAVRRIEQRDKAKPLFLYVPFNAPHSPMQAPKELMERYASRPGQHRAAFAAMVDRMDTAIGRILDALDKEGMKNDTLVFFFSDNGGPVNLGATNTPLRGAKGTTFEGGLRVPAVLRYPGKVKAGAAVKQVACAIDVFPTLAAAAGVTARNTLPLDGKNLWPVLSGQKKEFEREDLFFSVEPGKETYFAVRSGPWKLVIVEIAGKRQQMLFRIEEDPNEKNDVAAAHPEVVKDLAARIEKWKGTAPGNAERHSGAAKTDWKTPPRWAEAAR